jgi:hypothetical protein
MVNTGGLLPPGVRLCFEAADVGADPKDPMPSVVASRNAITSMTRMRDAGAAAFISTDDACFDEALVSSAWNMPFISSVSFNYALWSMFLLCVMYVSLLYQGGLIKERGVA